MKNHFHNLKNRARWVVSIGICGTLLLFTSVKTTTSNPRLIRTEPRTVIPKTYEDLTLEIHAKFSSVHGRFKLKRIAVENIGAREVIALPIIKLKKSNKYNTKDFTKPRILCGKKALKFIGLNRNEHLSSLIRPYTDDFDVVNYLFLNDKSYNDAETCIVSYNQLNIDVEGVATAIYIPLIEESAENSEGFSIKVVGDKGIKPFITNKDYTSTDSKIIEIVPKDKTPIIMGYGNSKKYGLKPYMY